MEEEADHHPHPHYYYHHYYHQQSDIHTLVAIEVGTKGDVKEEVEVEDDVHNTQDTPAVAVEAVVNTHPHNHI